MNNEQKPFEIKGLSRIGATYTTRNDYIVAANDEIRRLQEELADAPSWGEWVDATEEQLSNASAGVYELEGENNATEITFMFDGGWQTESGSMSDWTVEKENRRFRRLNYEPKAKLQAAATGQDDWTSITSEEQVEELVPGFYELKWRFPSDEKSYCLAVIRNDGVILVIESDASHEITSPNCFKNNHSHYKLIHAFEQPEKKYLLDGKEYTISELAGGFGPVAEISKLYLAAQARIRELEGK